MKLEDYLNFVTNARSIEELWSAHCDRMAAYGFDRLLYGFTRYRSGNSLGDPEDFVILTNHDPAYTRVYIGERLYLHAPMAHWALDHEGACSWNFISELRRNQTLLPEEAEVLAFNARMGVTAGYTVSFKSVSARSKGAIALTAPVGVSQAEVDATWRKHGAEILLINNVAHLKILTLPYFAPNRALTERQREVLEWVGDGKTTQDIATIMGLKVATVEKHLRLAREVLCVETTAQAVLKAAMLNQMFVLRA